MSRRAIQDGRVTVESSDETWSTGAGNGKPLQYSCSENPMNSMKRQKDMTLEDEPLMLEGVQYATGKSKGPLLIPPERMKWLAQSGNNAQLWMCLALKVQSCKEKCCIGTWNVRSMSQGKLDMVKQEMARRNINILGISELK